MDAIDHLRGAKTALQSNDMDGRSRSRLLAAVEEFWRATFYSGSWPEELRQAADAIVPLILAGGSVKTTVRMMDDAAAEDVLRRLSEFCDVAIASLTAARN